MGACATKPKTLEGNAPEEAPVETSKVATETTVSTDQVAADQTPEKVVEKAKEEPAAAELPTDVADQKAEVTNPEANNKEVEVEDKIVKEEKPSAPVEEKTAIEVVKKTVEVKIAEEEEEKPTQS